MFDPRVTADQQRIFIKKNENGKSQLLEFNSRTKVLAQNHGEIRAQYGDLFVMEKPLQRHERKVIMKFNNINCRSQRENYDLEQKIALTDQDCQIPDRTLFGEFSWVDQGWGGNKAGMKVMLNGKSVFYAKPGSCEHRAVTQGFSFKLSDYNAKAGDEVEFYYWTGANGGHSLMIWDLH